VKLDTSERIKLEPFTAGHAAELFPALIHPRIYTYIPDLPPTSVAALAERYRRLESRSSPDGSQQWLNWAIRHSESQECIGYVQATVHAAGTADFAFVLAPPFWGRGLAYEASVAALASLFREFSVPSVFAAADRRNLRSIALLLRLGFLRVLPTDYPHGTPEDSDDVFRLNRNDYQSA
jgi:[ribosomal protein S5]-alanine N-acetyltransferase